MRKGAALIRSEFGIDPSSLSDEEYIDLWTQAAWLHQDRVWMLARMLSPPSK